MTSVIKRYIRLLPPIVMSNMIIYLLMQLGAYRNVQVSEVTGSLWFPKFNNFDPNLLYALREAFFEAFFTGSTYYNNVLWMMPCLFLGALLVWAIAYLFGNKKWRYIVYAVLGFVMLLTHYVGVFLGFVLYDVLHTQKKLVGWIKKRRWIGKFIFLIGFYMSSYPDASTYLEGTIYEIMPDITAGFYHLAGAFLLVFSVLLLEPLQKFFGWKPFVKLGNISYSLYLVHFPVIATAGCFLFEIFYGKLSYNAAALLTFVVTTVLVVFISVGFSKYIEPLGKKGELYVEKFFSKNKA